MQVLNASVECKVITEAAEASEPLLFFCKIGKDRTGVLAALLLSCCGAKPEEIIADYHRYPSSSSLTHTTTSCCGAKPAKNIADYHKCSSSSTLITSCFWLMMR